MFLEKMAETVRVLKDKQFPLTKKKKKKKLNMTH